MATARAWMSSWCFFFYLFVAVSAILRAESSSATSDEFVLTLDSSNFSQTISKHPFIVVEFYAPWCGHCMKLAPEYEKAASVLSNHDPSIILAKVDANDELNKELASKYGVKGYPTVKILRDGGRTVQEYKGPRNADGIVEYLKKQVGPASAEIKSLEDVGNLINDKKIVIVGVFSEFSGEEFQNFLTLAEKLRSDHDFCHTLDAELLPRGGSAVNKPVIRLFKPFDELFVDFQDFHVDAMEKFIEEASVPTVTIFNNDPSNEPYLAKFFNNANVQVMLFLNFRSEYYVAFESKYHDVAQHYKGKNLSFLLGHTEATKRAFQFFGLKDDQEPLIIIHNSGGQKYLKQNLEPDHIAPWLKEYMEGKVKPFIKSEPIPEVNNDPVKNVVADNIHDAVLNSRKNVLLEIYAPWCGHCKKLAPILDEVAVSFKSDSDVIIAKIDGTANDIPTDTFDVKGYPALYFSSANGKVVPYDGNMTKEDIIEFILKNRDAVIQPNSMKDEL